MKISEKEFKRLIELAITKTMEFYECEIEKMECEILALEDDLQNIREEHEANWF